MLRSVSLITRSEEETMEVGAALGRFLRPGDMVFLIGELGSGKTRLAKGLIAQATGAPREDVVSPTFTLMNRFEGDFDVYHADLYRLAPEHVESIGLEDALDQGGALLVEWAERISWTEDDALVVRFQAPDRTDTRIIVLEWQDRSPWRERMPLILKEIPEGMKLDHESLSV
ncbi:tRNA (adenosine(37)-N6)-threonylcarbamoyltransferase complex ATPase subunit type 1 TsaE [Desulfomonile tiedjei]|uniref:tRNA threonylcarbamoyladenosine biosynthesis protein TsaE n=1 Tax=Desulfomonile tiedjei (strain ATCC 49306 / DSM 6799 / DCB-1) TaxID=706587 RepID=I4C7X1_DESTA|nr:tRNA (adenosine(37)-N6)-threonylcarbamoyltransferase complex ATPase subunit type 1 TsaE [Desulfomonile tiedjei]AFM25662.1 ATPase, YjeE family [Desulfomonile tiedjei DSM 6799]